MINVLGINMSHYSSACIFQDGRLVAAIPEERLNRVKFSAAFPEKSILKVLEISGVSPKEIDLVAIGTRCEMFDSNKAQAGEYRKTTRMVSLASRLLPTSIVESKALKEFYIHTLGAVRRYQFRNRYMRFFLDLGIPKNRLKYFDHHSSHAAAAYFLSPSREKTLVFTCDGNGDGDCGSVWIGENNTLNCRLRIPSIHSIGGLFSRTTKMMGMSPWQDEYKVMGLAPWGDKKKTPAILEKFRELWTVDGLTYKNLCGYAGDALVDHLRCHLKNTRFDYLAFGIQTLLEEMLTAWIRNNIIHHGIHRMAGCGGTFLNVKANKRIIELDEIKDAFWFPAAGDDSIAIGAAILATLELQDRSRIPRSIEPMTDVFWGEPIDSAIESFIATVDREVFSVDKPQNINAAAATLLAKDEIVARCTGRMEYGPRALGNRSIIANPSGIENIQKLNAMIKCRDFWMPFAGTVLDTAVQDYLINPKNIASPYMILSFDTRPEKRREIQAATHQADGTIRPQILTRDANPDYYEIISEFRRLTGIGAVLNTSLNLHGDPMVNLPHEAFHVLTHSALKYLIMGPYLIEKRMN